jgi:hypothetical protein
MQATANWRGRTPMVEKCAFGNALRLLAFVTSLAECHPFDINIMESGVVKTTIFWIVVVVVA